MKTTAGDRRRAASAGLASGGIGVVAVLLVLVNWLGFRHWKRADWTKAQIYSISGTTRKILADLKDPVEVTVFMTREARTYSQVRELLDRYKSLSPKIHVEELDPRRNPARAQALVDEFQVKENTVVFKSGSRKKYVTEDQIADFDFAGMPGQGGSIRSFKGEPAFTSAILAVTSARAPKIYFTSGHGERSIDDGAETGLSDVKDVLTKDNDVVATWDSLGKSEVPRDADVVVAAGPRNGFLVPEANALDQYLARGGHVLLLIDPVIPRTGAPAADLGLGSLVQAWGGKLDNDIVVDPGNTLPFIGAETVYVNHFGSHDIVRPLDSAKMAVILPLARSISTGKSSHAGFTATPLLQTTGDGWGETDLEHLSDVKKDPADVAAPVTLAIGVSKSEDAKTAGTADPAAGARLVAVGDSDFATNSQVQNVSNINFFLNSVHWLSGNENLVGIAPKTPEQTSLSLSSSQLRKIGALSLFGIPGLAVVLGIAVWIKRRR